MLKKSFYGKLQTPIIVVTLLLLLCYWLVGKHNEKGLGEQSGSRRKSRYRLIILILSSPDNLKERYAIRKTWLTDANRQTRHLFVIGTGNLDPDVHLTLKSEEAKYGDLLLLPKLHDSYDALTKKLLQSMAFAEENYDFEYLLKCDDDSFVLVNEVVQSLDEWQNSRPEGRHLYWGFFNGKANVKKRGPWKEPDWIFCDFYLPYALGGGYVLSVDLVRFIANNRHSLK